MKKIVLLLSFILLASSPVKADEKENVNQVLNNLHLYAANAKGDAYFDLFKDDAIYFGTDVGERWTKAQFKSYALPHFNKGNGWVYHKRERNIYLSNDKNVAWFDEVLDSKNYGTSRGTGVLVKTDKGWKFTQYHLTFPLPNDLAKDFTKQIMKFEAAQKNKK